MSNKSTQDGFTIIELMFSMTVFSFLLLAATAAIIQVGRMYYKGVTITKTQNVARQVIDDISRPIQFSGQSPVINNVGTLFGIAPNQVRVFAVCIGSTRYSYAVDAQVDSTIPAGTYIGATHKIRHALWRDVLAVAPGVCTPVDLRVANPTAVGTEMLSENMRLSRYCVGTPPNNAPACGGGGASGAGLYQIDVWLVYGDQNVLDLTSYPGHTVCQGGFLGTQFCAVSENNTVVTRRLR